MTLAKAAYGTILNWDGFDIAEVTNISGPSLSIDTIDATHYTSPDEFKEFIAGFADGGEVTLECNFIPTDTFGQIALIADAYAKEVKNVILTLGTAPGVAVWSFSGLITKLEFTEPMADKLGFSVTIKISGIPVLSVAESLGLSSLTDSIEQTGPTELDLIPDFANDKYFYTCWINGASTWVKIKATEQTNPHTIKVRFNGGAWIILSSGVLSGELAIGGTNTITIMEITCYEVGKIAKTYTVYIGRP